jgi:L-asparaginase II
MSEFVRIANVETPDVAFSGDVPMVAVMRGDQIGSLHRGSAAIVDAGGRLEYWCGNPAEPAFLRSAAKPFQIMPAVLHGAVDRFGINERELAVMCASHNGEQFHIEAVMSVLDKIGLAENALRCGIHPPMHAPAAAARWRARLEPSPACNNCSGAHVGMLLACRHLDWPLDNYGDSNHPLQVEIRRILANFAGIEPDDIRTAGDNCNVPTFSLPLDRAALAFARLATGLGVPESLSAAALRVKNAMTRHPEMVAGTSRFDTELMQAASSDIVAKSGAEGFRGCGITSHGRGIALKITDGDGFAGTPALMRLLIQSGSLDARVRQALQAHEKPVVFDLQGRRVGVLRQIFSLQTAG